MATFTRLPEDVLISILVNLTVPDVLKLKQTCRLLNYIGSIPLIWHHLFKTQIAPSIGGLEPDLYNNKNLQKLVVSSLQTDKNWKRDSPHLRNIERIFVGTQESVVDHVQLLNRGLALLTIRSNRGRSRPKSTVNIWNLSETSEVWIRWSFEIVGTGRFFDIHECEGKAIFAATILAEDGKGSITVCEFGYGPSDTIHHHGPFQMSPVSGLIHEVSVFGDIVAAIFVDLSAESHEHAHRIAFLNWRTGSAVQVEPMLLNLFLRLGIRIEKEHVILYCAHKELVMARLYALPELGYQGATASILSANEDFKLLAESSMGGSGAWPDLYVSQRFQNLDRPAPSLSFLLFPAISILSRPVAQHHALPMALVPGAGYIGFSEPTHRTLQVTMQSSPYHVCLGPTGRRGVWMEQNFESDELEMRLMRLAQDSNGDNGYNTSLLCPRGLPFPAHEVRCMAFEETNTRLAITLIRGDIWILDFGGNN